MGNNDSIKQARDQIIEKMGTHKSRAQHSKTNNGFEETEKSISNLISKDLSQRPSKHKYSNVRLNDGPKKHHYWEKFTIILTADIIKFIVGKQGQTIKRIQRTS